MVTFLWESTKPYKWYLILVLQAPIIGAMFIPVNQYAIKLTIDTLAVNSVFTTQDLILPIVLFVGGHITLELLWRISDLAEYKSLPFIKANLLNNAYSRVTNHGYSFFQNNLSGSISAKISGIDVGVNKIFNNFKLNIIHPVSMILVTLFFLYFISPVFIPVMLMFYLIFFPTVYFLSKKVSNFSANYANHKQKILGLVVDSIANIFSVLLFVSRKREIDSINKGLDELIATEKSMRKYEFILHIFIGTIYIVVSISILFLLIYLRKIGQITIGDFAFVLGGLTHMLEVAYILVIHIKDLVKDLAELKESFSIFDKKYEVIENIYSKPLELKTPAIKFQDISFSYNQKDKIFDNLSFDINAGEKIGVVGPSGAGKSTLISVLLKYFDLESGQILIDNQDIANVTNDSLRSQITIIPQDTTLFHRSVMDNIGYGKLGSLKHEIIAAGKKAHIHEFVNTLPDGYNTIVGERGMKLSGGQRQRIAIARAILKDSPILILDEATSSLDSRTEQYIQESLNLLIADKKKTVIAIAHRLSTLKHMDRIIVLDKGKIVAEGTHEELLINKKSLYSKLWELQAV